jgi:Insertion element 4 transposase N-terminal/Transposase DDE domain
LPVHRATSWGWESIRGRVLARAGLGVLSWVITPDLVDEAVGDGLAREMRLRSLPSRLGVYFVLGLCLFSQLPYGQVLRELTSGLQGALAAAGWAEPATTALTGLRRRVGVKPLESLFRTLAGALSPGREPWSHICGLLAAAWDGTTVAAAASEANIAAFGRPANGTSKKEKKRQEQQEQGDGGAGGPQLRLVVLVACGTRALLDGALGPLRGKGTGERELAGQLLGSLHRGMLLLADRGFYSWALWTAAAATGADLLWRVPRGMHLPVVQALPDGSWLTRIQDPAQVARRTRRNGARRRRGSRLPPDTAPADGITVRVIEFIITVTAQDGTTRTEPYRLITTLLDWRTAPAGELAAGYARRWAIELACREVKTCLRGPGQILRGRSPDLARQELWAYLVIYQALRVLITRAAAARQLDPARISFTAAVHTVRRTIITARDNMDTALARTQTELLTALTNPREGRVSPRAVKKPVSPYPSRNSHPGPISQHATYTITITQPGTTTQTTPHQPRHPQNQPSEPP